ncbi:MAG: DnaA/Hda family protein, partial [Verrucomicrobiota bacterium]
MQFNPDSQPQKLTEKEKLKVLWRKVSTDLREELGDITVDSFLPDFKLVKMEEAEAVIKAPGSGYALWAETNFKDSILSSLQKHLPSCESFRLDVPEEEAPIREKKSKSKKKKEKAAKLKERVLSEKISEEKLLERGLAAGLAEPFTFEAFVPGQNSELAWAAAQGVADKPASNYQPLFFHSACGLGKTHLLHAIGWESLRRRPKSRVLFVTAEQFSNDYI